MFGRWIWDPEEDIGEEEVAADVGQKGERAEVEDAVGGEK